VVKRSFQFAVEKIQSRKYDVSGEYVAFYDDHDQSTQKVVRQYSRLRIKQRGHRILAENILSSGVGAPRRWQLKGEGFRGYLIAGSYQEMGHRDSRSVGSFFVRQQQGSMDFSGFWSGWDEVNNQLSSGTYEFKRKPLKLRTSQSTDDDVIKIK